MALSDSNSTSPSPEAAAESRKHLSKCWPGTGQSALGSFPADGARIAPLCECCSSVVRFVCSSSTLVQTGYGPSFSQRSQTQPMLFGGKLHVHRELIVLYLKKTPFKSRPRGCNRNDQNHRGSGRKKGMSALSERPRNAHSSWVCPSASLKNTPEGFA